METEVPMENSTSFEPETDFTWERKPHPMCIPHIVDTILTYLSVPDLKSIRLVSSQYNEIACKALQHEETIVFKSIPQLETYLSKIKPISNKRRGSGGTCCSYSSSMSLCSELSALSTEEYGEEDEHLQQQRSELGGEKNGTDEEEEEEIFSKECWPYIVPSNNDDNVSSASSFGQHFHDEACFYHREYRYSHRSFHFDYCDPSTEVESVDQFFQTFGWQIQRLKYTTDLLPYNFPRLLGHMGQVWQNRLQNLEELVLEMKWGVPAHLFGEREDASVLLPSLKRLSLDILLTDRDADRAQVFFQELLSVTPNLEEISIPGAKRYFDDYINCVLARVILASELPRLSTLNFCLALSDAQMRLLTDKNLPLETLILDLEDLQFGDGGHNEENPQQPNGDNNENADEDEERQLEFLRQNNRRPSFTPIVKSTLQRFMSSVSSTLRSLHICFPQSPRHNLQTFNFTQDMTELKFLALGYYAGSSRILDHLPALKKLELWNVQFRDCHGIGKVVPDKHQGITSVIS